MRKPRQEGEARQPRTRKPMSPKNRQMRRRAERDRGRNNSAPAWHAIAGASLSAGGTRFSLLDPSSC